MGPGLGVDRHHVQVGEQDERRLGVRDGGRQPREAGAATGRRLEHLRRDPGRGQHLGAVGGRRRLAAGRVAAGGAVAHARRVDRSGCGSGRAACSTHSAVARSQSVIVPAGSRRGRARWLRVRRTPRRRACASCAGAWTSSASGHSASSSTSATTAAPAARRRRPISTSAAMKKPWIATRVPRRQAQVEDGEPARRPDRRGRGHRPDRDRQEGEHASAKSTPAAPGAGRRAAEEDERDQSGEQQHEGRERDQQLQPFERGRARGRVAQPSGQQAEAEGHEQPRVEVAGRDAEPAIGRADAAPGPQAHPDGDGVEGEVEADGQHASTNGA